MRIEVSLFGALPDYAASALVALAVPAQARIVVLPPVGGG